MTSRELSEHWDQWYRQGNLPWDTRRPEPRLTELVTSLKIPEPRAIDLGCGTGDNTLWLARHGYETLGIDIAETALRVARCRARDAGESKAHFACTSVLDPLPVPPSSVGVALDRGCFHTQTAEDRPLLAQRVGDALAPGGWWLILCGNLDEPRAEEQEGPPQLAAGDVVKPVETRFEVHALERSHFTDAAGQDTHLAWRAVLRKRVTKC